MQDIARNARLMPYVEDKGNLLATAIPDAAFADVVPEGKDEKEESEEARKARETRQNSRDAVLKALFRPLDMDSRLALIRGLIAKKQYNKAAACLTAFRTQLTAAQTGKGGSGGVVRPDTLSTQPRDAKEPELLDEEEVEQYLSEVKTLEDEVENVLPKKKIEVVSSKEEEIVIEKESN